MQTDRKSRRMRDGYAYKSLKDADSPKPHPALKQWSLLWRGINFVMVIFFLLAAYVQINDPDPYIWIPVYCVPAILSTVLVFKPEQVDHPVWRTVCVVHMGLCVAGSIYLIVVVVELLTGAFVNPLKHEEGRELGGLVIIIIWLGLCRFTNFGSTSSKRMNGLLLLTGVLALLPLVVWGLCFIPGVGKKLEHCHDMFPGVLGNPWGSH